MRGAGFPARRMALLARLACVAALATTSAAAGDAPSLPGPATPRPLFVPTPFGPGYDTMRPEPVEPAASGKGIELATLVAAAPATVEEERDSNDPDTANLFGVVLDVRIAAASTVAALDATGIVLRGGSDAAAQGVYALCLPGAEPPLAMTRSVGVRIDDWHIAVGDRAFRCGGRNMRLASRVGAGGVTVTTTPAAPWQGTVVLLFRSAPAGAAELKVAGVAVQVPAPPAPPVPPTAGH